MPQIVPGGIVHVSPSPSVLAIAITEVRVFPNRSLNPDVPGEIREVRKDLYCLEDCEVALVYAGRFIPSSSGQAR